MKRYKIKTDQGEIIADLVESGPIMKFQHDGGKIEIDWLLFCDLFSIGGIAEVQPRPQDGRICNCEDAPCCGCYSLS